MKKYMIAAAALLASMAMAGCDKTVDMREPKPVEKQLTVEGSKFSIKIGEPRTITITSGNGGYEVESNDERVATVEVSEKGIVTVNARSEGQAMVTVSDKLGKQAFFSIVAEKPYFLWVADKEYLDVQVYDPNLYTIIRDELMALKTIPDGCVLEFVAGAERTLVKYESSEKMRKGEVAATGSYIIDGRGITFSFDGNSDTYIPQDQMASDMIVYIYTKIQGATGPIPGNAANSVSDSKAVGPKYLTIGKDYTEHYISVYGQYALKKVSLSHMLTPTEYKNLN